MSNEIKLSYSIKNVVQITDISRSKIYELIKQGQLRTFKLGKRTLVADEDLRAFLNKCRITSFQGAAG